MHLKRIHILQIVLFLTMLNSFQALAQNMVKDSVFNEIEGSTDLIKGNLLSTHPLGIYLSRINHNFKIRCPEKYSFSFEVSSGNVVLPYVKSYDLMDPIDRERSKSVPWHMREYAFNLDSVPSKTREFIADGVIRSYRFNFSLGLSSFQELNFGIRANSLDGGRYPYSIVTSDASIEWFHSNIAGGEDPFSRKYYGYDKAEIYYKDENNRVIKMNSGDFSVNGVEVTHSFYPKLTMNRNRKLYVNFNTHLGVNVSKYNPSMDLGFSSSLVKKNIVKGKDILTFGVSVAALRQGLVRFGDNVVFSDKKILPSFEFLFEYKQKLRNKNHLSYGVNFTNQSSYNKRSEFDNVVLTGKRLKTHWQQTFYHFYENLQGWNFMLTYSVKKTSYYVYFREDLKLDNAPDLQAGFGVKLLVK